MKNKSPMFNLNKGYNTPLNVEDGLIVKAFRSLGSDYSKFKVQQQRIKSGSAKDPKLEGVPTKTPEFSMGNYDKAAADAQLKKGLAETKMGTDVSTPTASKAIEKPATPKPRVKVSAQQVKSSGTKDLKVSEAKVDSKIKPIAKEVVSSRKSRRLEKTVGKAVEAKAKANKAIEGVKSAVGKDSAAVAKNQAKALQQKRKYDRLEKRAVRISNRK